MTGVDRTGFGVSRDRSVEDRAELAEDRVLLARLRDGEDAAFGELFSRHAKSVRGLARTLTNDRAEADDLTAEAFFRVLQAIRHGSGPVDNVRGYLLLVVRRVAGEWRVRRRDVPVSDEELTHHAGHLGDGVALAAESNLIVRAFTSLPERWRSVLWKVEVEGERPAVVATNFGLSPNATAALARRARQGLRAAYLQAHLTADRGATGCRSVLEKLGAYTAGSIKGSERRRISGHLGACPSCSRTHDELRDVCSGLRAHAGALLVPAGLGTALAHGVGSAGSAGSSVGHGLAGVKTGLFGGVKLKALLATASAAAVGVAGLVAGPLLLHGPPSAMPNLDGDANLAITSGSGSQVSATDDWSVAGHTGSAPAGLASSVRLGAQPDPSHAARLVLPSSTSSTSVTGQPVTLTESATVQSATAESAAEDSDVVYAETTVYRATVVDDNGTRVQETTVVTRVNAAGQTTSYSQTRTSPAAPAASGGAADPTVDSADPADPADPEDSAAPSDEPGSSTSRPCPQGSSLAQSHAN